jgi:putative transposase
MPLFHVWFATKNRLKFLEGDLGDRVQELFRSIAAEKGIRLIESMAILDHVHMLLEVPDKTALSRAMNDLKGVSSRRLTQEFGAAKHDLHISSFWQHRYASTIVPSAAADTVRQYIRTQWDRLEKYEH